MLEAADLAEAPEVAVALVEAEPVEVGVTDPEPPVAAGIGMVMSWLRILESSVARLVS